MLKFLQIIKTLLQIGVTLLPIIIPLILFLDSCYKKLTKKMGVENLKNFFAYAIMIKTKREVARLKK